MHVLSLVTFLGLIVVSDSLRCSGWHWRRYRNKCYFFSRDRVSWYDAQTTCRVFGGKLAEVVTSGQENFLRRMVATYFKHAGYWAGGSDLQHEGHWKWVTTSRWITSNLKWHRGQPDNWNGKEHCLHYMYAWKGWNDDNCGDHYNYICEK